MSASPRRTVRFTKPILEYLKELVQADLANGDITPDERFQGKAALKRISAAIRAWDEDRQTVTHKELLPYLLVPADMANDADWRTAYQRKTSLEGREDA